MAFKSSISTFKKSVLCLSLAAAFALPSFTGTQQIAMAQDAMPTPEAYFGFKMGADRKLAHWDDLVKYYNLLGEQSDRMKVVNMGKTTQGRPFLALYISSPENLARLEEYKKMNAVLTDPRGHSQATIDNAIENSKAVVVQSMGLHSTEVAAAQMSAELVHDMLTRDDEEMSRIREETISILIPAFNPDGEAMITEWYRKTVGSRHEGSNMPSLYHHYIGHDNNRDAYMQNTVESYYGAEIIFREWVPQAYVDHHQMGAYSARFYVPPYSNPFRPGADPLVWREMSWYGAQIAYKAEEVGQTGVINGAMYSGWGHFGFHWITPFHNIAGMLTESASAKLATPLFVHPDQLKGGRRAMPNYKAQTTHPNPWPGGWWRVRNIVEQQKTSAISLLDLAAKNRTTVLKNGYLKAKRQIERGAAADVKAYIIPATQHDKITKDKMTNVLMGQGIEVQKANNDFVHEGKTYKSGTYIVTMAQPKQGVTRWLLGRTFYPDDTYTRNRDNSPVRPYDMSTDNIAEYMGVRVDPVKTAVNTPSTRLGFDGYTYTATSPATLLRGSIKPKGMVATSSTGYVMDGRLNNSFKALNLLWDAKVKVSRVDSTGNGLNAGDFIVPKGTSSDVLSNIAAETGVDFTAAPSGVDARAVKRQRIGMYQRYYGGNMPEGWNRLVLEQFNFKYKSLFDAEITKGNLIRKFDVIILPSDSPRGMTELKKAGGSGYSYRDPEDWPKEFRSGMTEKGIENLVAFVEAGGTLLAMGDAGEFAIKHFALPLRNVLKGVSTKEFWSPGSTLRMDFDNNNPMAYGMPDDGVGLFLGSNDAWEIIPSNKNHKVDRIATFKESNIMQSGWLVGEKYISEKATAVSVGVDKGTVVLVSFRAQHRAQTHGTYKLMFNALVSGPKQETK